MSTIQLLKLGYLFRQGPQFRGRVHRAHPGNTTAKEAMTSPLAYSIAETCVLAHCGRTTIYKQINSGKLRAVKRGRRTIVFADDLRAWLEALPAFDVTTSDHTAIRPPRDGGTRETAAKAVGGRQGAKGEKGQICFLCAWATSSQTGNPSQRSYSTWRSGGGAPQRVGRECDGHPVPGAP